QEEAMELADTLVVMNQGRIEQLGSPSAIYDQPATPFVARFVGGAKVLGGRGENGRATVGSLSAVMPAPPGASDGAELRAFVRPHEVKLTKMPSETPAEPEGGDAERQPVR